MQDLQDELEDLTEQSNELQEVMGRSYDMPDVNEDELEAELDALGDEIALDDDTSYLDDAVRAPNAPTTVPGADSIPARVRDVYNFALYAHIWISSFDAIGWLSSQSHVNLLVITRQPNTFFKNDYWKHLC